MQWPLITLVLLGCRGEPADEGKDSRDVDLRAPSVEEEPLGAELLVGQPVPRDLAQVPRFRPGRDSGTGLRCLPDGDLGEWKGKEVVWLEPVRASSGSPGPRARLALASYGSGLSLAVAVQDDVHVKARVQGALPRSDHIDVKLWPHRKPRTDRPTDAVLGVHLRLGTDLKLVKILKNARAWREGALSSTGVSIADGYQVEARLPLSMLTPLPVARVKQLHYSITIFDSDAEGEPAKAAFSFEGMLELEPALEVPEAVQKRASIRICRAAYPEALWGYVNGWRCVVPYRKETMYIDDTRPTPSMGFAVARLPEPPSIVWIRERVVFINMLGLERGVAALLDKSDTLLSMIKLGVVGGDSPGNARTKHSDAEPMLLPDGTYAVATVHAFPARPGPLGGRCAGGHRVYLSILALRGALKSTPHDPAPEPETPPYLEEVFRTLLEDCSQSVANDWTLSRDRSEITVHSSLYPSRPASSWIFKDGRYQPTGSR